MFSCQSEGKKKLPVTGFQLPGVGDVESVWFMEKVPGSRVQVSGLEFDLAELQAEAKGGRHENWEFPCNLKPETCNLKRIYWVLARNFG
jgi:hypothetical protein